MSSGRKSWAIDSIPRPSLPCLCRSPRVLPLRICPLATHRVERHCQCDELLLHVDELPLVRPSIQWQLFLAASAALAAQQGGGAQPPGRNFWVSFEARGPAPTSAGPGRLGFGRVDLNSACASSQSKVCMQARYSPDECDTTQFAVQKVSCIRRWGHLCYAICALRAPCGAQRLRRGNSC